MASDCDCHVCEGTCWAQGRGVKHVCDCALGHLREARARVAELEGALRSVLVSYHCGWCSDQQGKEVVHYRLDAGACERVRAALEGGRDGE